MDTPDLTDLLRRFLSLDADVAAISSQLRPTSDDYAGVFEASCVDTAKAVYESAWSCGSLVIRAPRAEDVLVWSVTTEELREGAVDAASPFASEWLQVAVHLSPGRRFFAFRFVDSEGSAVAGGDGLTFVRGRWRWFPSPGIALRERLRTRVAPVPASRPDARPAPPARRRLPQDLDIVTVAADRAARDALLADPVIVSVLSQVDVRGPSLLLHRSLLERGVRIARSRAPDIFRIVDAARERVKLLAEVEIYTGLAFPELGLAAVPPALEGTVALFLAPFIINHFDASELAFVVGHELGHVVLDHHLIHPKLMQDHEEIPPYLCARMFSWHRQAELSADRIGLLCCDDLDAAMRAMFKLTTGLRRAQFANAHDLLAQQRELVLQEHDDQDWFRTHPWSPLRLTALQLFARSCLYRRVQGRTGGELTDSALDGEIDALLSFMNPPPIGGTEDEAIQRFLAFGVFFVGMFDRPAETVAALVSGAPQLEDVRRSFQAGDVSKALTAAAHAVLLFVPARRRIKIIEDLVSVALRHDGVSADERKALEQCTAMLRLDERVLERAIKRLQNPLD